MLPVAVDEAGAGNAIACHATAAELERMRAEEDLCQSVLANFSVDAARQCVCVTLQPRGKNSQSLQHSSVKAPVCQAPLAVSATMYMEERMALPRVPESSLG